MMGTESGSENFIQNAKNIATTKTIRDGGMWYYDAAGHMKPWDYNSNGNLRARGVFFGDPFGKLHP